MATCEAMCPAAEIDFRSRNLLINQLEATPSSCNGPKSKFVADPNKMVKEYSRSAADTHNCNKPELLRPFAVLDRTIDHLLQLYAPFQDRRESVTTSEFSSVFSFVSDRLRAVRQDMIMQDMKGKHAALLIEKMLPFYIETDGLCKMGKCSSYDRKLHDFQLEECFGRWYKEVTSSNIVADPRLASCFFFRQLRRNPTILHNLHLFRNKLPPAQFDVVLDVISSFLSNNYYRFFADFALLDSLEQYSLSDAISHIRQSAMRTISMAFKTSVAKLPIQLISKWLGFPDDLEFFVNFLQLYKVYPDKNGSVLIASIKPVEISDLEFSSRQF